MKQVMKYIHDDPLFVKFHNILNEIILFRNPNNHTKIIIGRIMGMRNTIMDSFTGKCQKCIVR